MFRSLVAASLAAIVASLPHAAGAQTYPNRPIRVIVPFAPGAPDAVARVIGQQISTQMGQPVVVENRPGANGLIGSEAVVKSPPDGYTLLVTSTSFAVNPSMYRKLPYDAMRDFSYISGICGTDGLILAVNPQVPAKNLQEFLALARKPDAKLSFGSPGVGNTLHLASELLNAKAGLSMVHVPYKGAGPAIAALVGGEIEVMFVTPPLSLPHIKAGKLRPLAYSGEKRWSVMPELPTMEEAGLPGYTFDGGWYGMFAAAGTPPEVVKRLDAEVKTALANATVKERLATLGLVPMGLGPTEFKALVEKEIRKYGEIVKIARIQPE